MRFSSALAAVGATFAGFSSAQQYAGEVIPNSLPFVPGSEITYFKIPGILNKGKNQPANLTLINYYSHGKDNKRLVESKIKRAVIIIHGLNRDPGTYQANMMSALSQVTDKSVNLDNVAIMSPYFTNGNDKNYGYPYDTTLATSKSYTSALVWQGSQWSAGGNNQYPTISANTSSYFVLDTLIKYFDNKTLFPNMNQIVVAGHSLGAQTVHRYAALGAQLGTSSPVTYWVANPNSFIWLDTTRPLSIAGCPTYDDYRDGYSKFIEYNMTYGLSLVAQGRSAILANYNSKQVAYGRGTQDNGDDSSSCEPFTTGANRNERFFNFIKQFPISCPDPAGRNCDTVDFVNMGHDGGGMMASVGGRARLFTDNFNGTGNRAYDTGYPRQQAGDDPYPDPALNGTSASVNNNTYAGNMTYAGCWSDSGSSRSLLFTAYDNSQNSIDLCTSTCNSKGYTIAGMEVGSQCYCGNSLTSQATKVIESSCVNACPANSSQICGGYTRLSIFSNGVPVISAPPSTPETINDSWYTQGCYTEAAAGTRALAGKSTTSNSLTLESCGTFCKGYKYFGTEYSSECYCSNTINSQATLTMSDDCSMTCAGNPLEYCGAGNRLTLYTDTAYVAPTGTSTTSTLPGSTAPAGSGPSCPGSDGQTVVSNGLNFTIECGIDHAGGDLTSATVANFQGCIDLCSANSQCVDVSLSGTACYLKKTLGGAVSAPAIWGAKLAVGGSVSSSTSTSATSATSATSDTGSTSSVSVTSSSASSVSSTSSASSTATPLACPGSDATTYTAASGKQFLVECGIDHTGGDIASKNVANFQGCIDYCDQTPGCVDVSLSGFACYLKGTLGAAVNAPAIWGAKAVSSVVSSSSSSSLIASTSSTTTSGSSTTASISSPVVSSTTASSSTVSTSSTSASASASASAVSCPGSNGFTYTLASGSSYLIECGIDHAGGDLSSKTVGSFAECIALCDSTAKCVDVSLSGVACYLKSSVGAAVNIPQVFGAKLLAGSSSSSAASSTSTSTSVLQNAASTTSNTSNTDTSVPTTTSSSIVTTSSSTDTSVSTTSSSTVTSVPSTTSSSSSTDTSVPTTSSSSISTGSLSDTSVPSTSATSSTLPVSSTTFSTSTVSSSSASSTTSSTTLLTTTSSATSATSSASSSTSTAASLPSGISYLGCYVDGSTRALSFSNGTSSTQTPSQCATNCRARGYKYSGTEYANECYCSNAAPTNLATADSQCNMNCAGDSTKKCGAGNRLSVYSDANWVQTFFATPSYSTWNLMGCYVDSAGARSLGTGVNLAAYGGPNNASIANCVSACQAQGFTYCGAEYYSECYGSKTAPATSVASGSDPLSAGCSYACKGNSTESCGGSNRIIVYTNNGTASQ